MVFPVINRGEKNTTSKKKEKKVRGVASARLNFPLNIQNSSAGSAGRGKKKNYREGKGMS